MELIAETQSRFHRRQTAAKAKLGHVLCRKIQLYARLEDEFLRQELIVLAFETCGQISLVR